MKKTRNGFFLVIVILINLFLILEAQAQTSTSQTPNNLKILTLNFNAETDNEVLTLKRLGILENYITQNDIDVIFIQECWHLKNRSAATWIAGDLNMDGIYHMEDGLSGVRVTSLCMVTKKSLQLRNVVSFKLPRSAFSIGNGESFWASFGESNMLIGATITLPSGHKAFLWTAHLTDISSADRVNQIDFAINQMIKMTDDNGEDWNQSWTIFGGDFNTTPDTPEMAHLGKVLNFQDAWTLSHPEDPGRTFVAEVNDPEYNPMSHASGLFPSQATFQTSGRFDYLFIHGPGTFSTGTTRVFTSPVGDVWMSDHFGLRAIFDFTGAPIEGYPSADSDMASLGHPTTFSIDDNVLKTLPEKQDFDVTSSRGFTLLNQPDIDVLFSFTSNKGAVYPASHATIGKDNTISFAFFGCGDYDYDLSTFDYRDHKGVVDYAREPVFKPMSGTVHVR